MGLPRLVLTMCTLRLKKADIGFFFSNWAWLATPRKSIFGEGGWSGSSMASTLLVLGRTFLSLSSPAWTVH